MNHITPEILRKAQTHLTNGNQFEPAGMWQTTCHAIEEASGLKSKTGCPTEIFKEACDLIREQVGTVWPIHVLGKQRMTLEQIQGGRFMYLELLALAIEDGCL